MMDGILELLLWIFRKTVTDTKTAVIFAVAIALIFVGVFMWLSGLGTPEVSTNATSMLGLVLCISGAVLLVVTLPLLRIYQDSVTSRALRYRLADARSLIDELREGGKLTRQDNPLIMANCADAHLNGVDLYNAYLRMVGLERADLQGANLSHANLRSARLEGANLRESDLRGAILRYARLHGADLTDARLDGADLIATDFSHAQLQGAVVEGANFDATTTLPDGRKWTAKIDLRQYGMAS